MTSHVHVKRPIMWSSYAPASKMAEVYRAGCSELSDLYGVYDRCWAQKGAAGVL